MKFQCRVLAAPLFSSGLLALSASMPALAQSALTVTPWEIHEGEGVQTYDSSKAGSDQSVLYTLSDIPAASDAGWIKVEDSSALNKDGSRMNGETINMVRKSSIPGSNWRTNCAKMLDYTYFQTFLDIGTNMTVEDFKIAFDGMDDGSRITVFNDQFPDGRISPGSYVASKKSGTADLKDLLAQGKNRIVITQVDNCAYDNNLQSATVVLNGETLEIEVEAPDPTSPILAYSIYNQSRGTASAPDYFVGIRDGAGMITTDSDPFMVVPVPGDDGSVFYALRSGDGSYLAGGPDRFTVTENMFDKGVLFYLRSPLEPEAGKGFFSLESVEYPGQYMRHQSFRLMLDEISATSASLPRRDATFSAPVRAEIDVPLEDIRTCRLGLQALENDLYVFGDDVDTKAMLAEMKTFGSGAQAACDRVGVFLNENEGNSALDAAFAEIVEFPNSDDWNGYFQGRRSVVRYANAMIANCPGGNNVRFSCAQGAPELTKTFASLYRVLDGIEKASSEDSVTSETFFDADVVDKAALRQSCLAFLDTPSSKQPGVAQVAIDYANETGEDRYVSWINFEGNVNPGRVVKAGESYTGESFSGHRFVVMDSDLNCTMTIIIDKNKPTGVLK